MPRAAPKTAIPADDQPTIEVQEDPGHGFDDLRRNGDLVEVASTSPEGGKPEAPEAGDLEKMTQAMRKRLMRERKRSDRIIAEREEEFRGTLAEMQAKIDALGKLQKAGTTTIDQDAELSGLEEQMTEALEKGDSKKVSELNRKMAEKVALKSRHTPDEPLDLEPERPEPKKPVRAAVNPKFPKVQEWVAEQEWWDNPDYAHIRNFIAKAGEGLDSKLQAAGYSPNEDAYFIELERIVDERFPNVIVKVSDRPKDEFSALLDDETSDDIKIRPKSEVTRRPARQAAPVRGADDGAQIPADDAPRGRGSLRISADDVANMRRFGMDPRNPDHVKGYIENRGDANG